MSSKTQRKMLWLAAGLVNLAGVALAVWTIYSVSWWGLMGAFVLVNTGSDLMNRASNDGEED